MSGPRLRDLRLSKQRQYKRRMVKVQRHQGKGARMMWWCPHCEKFTYRLETHVCGERQT